MQNLKGKIVRGGAAKAVAQVGGLALRIGSLMVLARILEPKDFGLVAMATAATGLLSVFRDFGLSAATIQQTTITEAQISALFWLNLALGVLLTIIAVACAPILANFYDEPGVFGIVATLALGFLASSLGVQHAARLQREMRFTTLAKIDYLSLMVSVIVGITMALHGMGYWSLVGMTLTLPIVYSISVWIITSWIPGPPRRHTGIESMIRFGGTVTMNSVVVYFAYNLDKLLIGKFFGADALGLYGRAYQLINIPTDTINGATGDIAFAGLARVKNNPELMRNYFLKGYSLVVSITLPITVTCAFFADDLILTLLGEKWAEAIPIFQLLAPTTLIYAMINPMTWLMFAIGLVGRSLTVALVLAPIIVVGYLIGLPYGPKGVAAGFSAAMALWAIPHIAWCVRGTCVKLSDILRAIIKPLSAALLSGALAYGAVSLLPQIYYPALRLLIAVSLVFTFYTYFLLFMMNQKSFYLSLFRELRAH